MELATNIAQNPADISFCYDFTELILSLLNEFEAVSSCLAIPPLTELPKGLKQGFQSAPIPDERPDPAPGFDPQPFCAAEPQL